MGKVIQKRQSCRFRPFFRNGFAGVGLKRKLSVNPGLSIKIFCSDIYYYFTNGKSYTKKGQLSF